MNRWFVSIAALVLASGVWSVPVMAQDMSQMDMSKKKDTAVKPAPSPSQAVLDSWNESGRKLTALGFGTSTEFFGGSRDLLEVRAG